MRKLILCITAIVLSACATHKTPPTKNMPSPTVVKHIEYQKSVSYKFDVLLDNPINPNDPRIKSILYSVKQSPNNYIAVTYYNKKAKKIAKNMAKIFTDANIHAITTKLNLDASNKENIKYIFVTEFYGVLK